MISLNNFKACPSVISLPAGLDLSQALKVCTDSRKYQHPSAFVAIPGSKVNPLDLMTDLLQRGCPLVVYQTDSQNEEKIKKLSAAFPDTTFVAVKDSVTFLQELSRAHVLEWKSRSSKNKVFAISGSNGKTTHKEMLSFILKKALPGKIVSTEKNNNNHLGVPLTLLQIEQQTEFVVLELGSNHPGEIKVLCDIAQPDAGITTNIGATHLEFFGSEEKVFEEEAYLYHAIKSVTSGNGFYLINIDDQYLKGLPVTAGSVTYGESSPAMARVAYHADGAAINYQGKEFVVRNAHITGRHNKLNLITCYFIACHFFPQLKEALYAASSAFLPTRNRSEWIEFEGKPVFLDAYNANPSSMKAALEGFKESVSAQGLSLGQACVVLGDMNELGERAPEYHQDLGRFVKNLGFKHVYFVGRFAPYYLQGYADGVAKNSSSEFKHEYRNECLKNYAIHFIKGSRSLQLESLFDIT